MPFEVRLLDSGKYGVYNLAKGKFAKRAFATQQKAENMIKVWMAWAHWDYAKPKTIIVKRSLLIHRRRVESGPSTGSGN